MASKLEKEILRYFKLEDNVKELSRTKTAWTYVTEGSRQDIGRTWNKIHKCRAKIERIIRESQN